MPVAAITVVQCQRRRASASSSLKAVFFTDDKAGLPSISSVQIDRTKIMVLTISSRSPATAPQAIDGDNKVGPPEHFNQFVKDALIIVRSRL
jgi:hypothetical protein